MVAPISESVGDNPRYGYHYVSVESFNLTHHRIFIFLYYKVGQPLKQPSHSTAKRRRLIPSSVQANPVPIEAVDLTLPPPRGTDQPTEVQIEPVRAFPPPVRITN